MYHVFIDGERYFTTHNSSEVRDIALEFGYNYSQWDWDNGVEVHELPDDTNIVTTSGESVYGSPTWEAAGFLYTTIQDYGKFEYDHESGNLYYEQDGKRVVAGSDKYEGVPYEDFVKSCRNGDDNALFALLEQDFFETIEEWIERKCKTLDIPISEPA